MNYTWQLPASGYSQHWRLDYSHMVLPALEEANLNEPAGLGAPAEMFAGVQVPFGGSNPPIITYASMQSGIPVDWDGDGDSTATVTAMDINFMSASYQIPSAGETLVGHNDWSNLKFSMFGSDFADGVHSNTTLDTEMTEEIFDELDAIPPAPVVCLADTNGDTLVNVTDLLILLGGWGPNPGHAADISGDGEVNVTDLLALLAAWGACP